MVDKPCTHCGKCCENIPCGIGLSLLGDYRPCVALETDEDGTKWCGLARHAEKYLDVGKHGVLWKRAFVARLMKAYNAMGVGCDRSPMTDLMRHDMGKLIRKDVAAAKQANRAALEF